MEVSTVRQTGVYRYAVMVGSCAVPPNLIFARMTQGMAMAMVFHMKWSAVFGVFSMSGTLTLSVLFIFLPGVPTLTLISDVKCA